MLGQRCSLFPALVVLLSHMAFGQQIDKAKDNKADDWEKEGRGSYLGVTLDRHFSIPNPNDRLAIANFASNPSVAKEIQMSDEQLSYLRSAIRRFGGGMDVISTSFSYVNPKDKPSPAQIDAVLLVQRRERESIVDEVFSPKQWERLRQIVYHAEVARVGLAEAISNGRLGEDIGVHENQRTALSQKAEKIQAKLEDAISKAKSEAQKELLRELTPEQRTAAEKCLGEPFNFHDDIYQLLNRR